MNRGNEIMENRSRIMQLKLLEMLKWFHKLCEDNNIRYYALGGTMLGAVRHGGFIPWDDDIDVGIPRKDYIRLIRLMQKHSDDRYILETPLSEDPTFCYPYSKLYDTKTTLLENSNKKLKRGLFIDVFPLDMIGDSMEKALKNYKKIKALRDLVTLRTLSDSKDRSAVKKAVVRTVQAVPSVLVSEKHICIYLEKICTEYSKHGYKFGGNLHGAWGAKELMSFDIMGKPTLYRFEDTYIYGAENYDEYLTHLYGNWNELPPEDKRVSHHDFLLFDLDKPYAED